MKNIDTSITKYQMSIIKALMIANLFLIVFQYLETWYFTFFGKITGNDYASFYTGWSMIRDGLWKSLYSIEGQGIYQTQLFGSLAPLYIHPPHSAVPFLGLSLLPYGVSNFIWISINYICLALLLWQLWREWVHTWQPFEQWGFFIIVLAFPAVPSNIFIGNISLIASLILLNLIIQMRRGNIWWVGVLLFLGTVKYQLFIVVGLYLLGARWWRSVLVGIGLTIVAIIATALVMGWDIWIQYAALLQAFSGFWNEYGITPRDGFNLRALLASVLGRDQTDLLNQISVVFLVLGGIIAFVLGRLHNHQREEWSIGFIIPLSLYTSPHLYVHDLTILIIGATLFYNQLRKTHSYRHFLFYTAVLSIPWIIYIILFNSPTTSPVIGTFRAFFLLPILYYIWKHRPHQSQLQTDT